MIPVNLTIESLKTASVSLEFDIITPMSERTELTLAYLQGLGRMAKGWWQFGEAALWLVSTAPIISQAQRHVAKLERLGFTPSATQLDIIHRSDPAINDFRTEVVRAHPTESGVVAHERLLQGIAEFENVRSRIHGQTGKLAAATLEILSLAPSVAGALLFGVSTEE